MNLKDSISKALLLIGDLAGIYISIYFAYSIRLLLEGSLGLSQIYDAGMYLNEPLFYIVPILIFMYEGIYTSRYDFWHESREVLRSLLLSVLIVFSALAMLKQAEEYSRMVIVLSFAIMMFFIPLIKNIGKKFMFKLGLWKKSAKVFGCDIFVGKEIFSNPYLGYILSTDETPETVFINSKDLDMQERNNLISEGLKEKYEVVFIPIMNDFDMTQSHVYILQNTRTNVMVFSNKLASTCRMMLQLAFNYVLAILLLPVLLPIIGVLAFLIKKESQGPIFFAHNRIGKNGKIIPTYKFRSMYSDAKERLDKLLEDDVIRKEWEENFKLKDDPRVTKIGNILRKTSLDELPQIFNVLKGEMNFVGPRPVIQDEIDQYYKEDSSYYLMVKPGITGLWQVSGRSDTDYDFRVKTDKYYVVNWSLWLDIVILFKTVKVVLKRDGAY